MGLFSTIFFSIQTLSFNMVEQLVIAFVGFSSIASMVYIINDIIDADLDKIHPKKKSRPIAAGTITKKQALIIALILGCVGTSISFFGNAIIYLQLYFTKYSLLIKG